MYNNVGLQLILIPASSNNYKFGPQSKINGIIGAAVLNTDIGESHIVARWLRVLPLSDVIDIGNHHRGHTIILGHQAPLQKSLMNFMERFPNNIDPDNSENAMSSFPTIQRPEDSYYRCSRCKYPVAPAHAVFSFTPEHNIFQDLPGCTHIFLAYTLSWMRDQIHTSAPGGKLYCPNCNDDALGPNYVGEYCWLGVQCENAMCAEIVSPGLALIRRLQGNLYTGVEFRQVAEDGEETYSSQETNEEFDEEDEQQFAGDLPEGDSRPDGDGDWDEIENQFAQPPNTELLPSTTQESRTPMEELPSQIIQPENTEMHMLNPVVASRPSMRNLSLSLRHPRHVPFTPSRLRNSWIPRSAPSTTESSQGSQTSVNYDGLEANYSAAFTTESDERVSPPHLLQWLATTDLQASPDTSSEVIGQIDEYLIAEGIQPQTLAQLSTAVNHGDFSNMYDQRGV
jgi:hypothetical protein